MTSLTPSDTRSTAASDCSSSRRILVFCAVFAIAALVGLHALGILLIDRFASRVIAAHSYHLALGIPTLLIVAPAVAHACRGTKQLNVPLFAWIVFPAILPFACAVWGVLFAHGRGSYVPSWQSNAIPLMFVLCATLGVLAVTMTGGQRWLIASIVFSCIWMCFWAAVYAGMSVTGDWM